MESTCNPNPEDWWKSDNVQLLLNSILEHPGADHTLLVHAALQGRPLINAHVHGLVRALDRATGKSKKKTAAHFVSRPVALHGWLFHLGGAAGLHPPPLRTTDAGAVLSKAVEAAATAASKAFFTKRDNLLLSQSRGCPTAAGDLASLRSQAYNILPLQIEDFDSRQGATGPKRVATAPPAPPPADPADAELRRRADGCLALAMGTHGRLGVASGVRLLLGEHDVLRLVVHYADMRTTAWVARPPPKEVPTLRRHLMLEHAELSATRGQLDDALTLIRSLMVENRRTRRQLESAERRNADADERAENIREAAGVWQQAVLADSENHMKRQRQEHAASMHEQKRELTDMIHKSDQKCLEVDAQRIRELEPMSGDRREDLQRLAEARSGLAREAASLERQFREQEAATERLRNARNGSTLEWLQTVEAENKKLKQRRTLNQRRQSDANVADRRVREAKGQVHASHPTQPNPTSPCAYHPTQPSPTQPNPAQPNPPHPNPPRLLRHGRRLANTASTTMRVSNG